MKRLLTICAVVGLMLGTTCASWASTGPIVSAPPGAPSWWNVECIYYAYGWWEDDLQPDISAVSPPDDVHHWASNFLSNTGFSASVTGTTITVFLDNEYRPDLYKEIYIYLTGTTTSTEEDIISSLDTNGGTFDPGTFGGSIAGGDWLYFVSGEIHPQPDYVQLDVTVPGLTGVTNIWAGENCVPEPATIALLGIGALGLLRRKTKA